MSHKPALPEGVVAVHDRSPVPEEDLFYIEQGNVTNAYRIYQGRPMDSTKEGVHVSAVKPAPGWKFVRQFDIKQYVRHFLPARIFEAPVKLSAQVSYTVDNSVDQQTVQSFLNDLEHLPGFDGKPRE